MSKTYKRKRVWIWILKIRVRDGWASHMYSLPTREFDSAGGALNAIQHYNEYYKYTFKIRRRIKIRYVEAE